MEQFSLKTKVVAITGAGSGIGQAIATLFAEMGAIVHIIEINDEAATSTRHSIEALNGKAFVHSCNVSDATATSEVFENILKESERLDILVNSAGIAHIGRLDNTAESDFDKVVSVNVKGVYNTMKPAVAQMKKQGGGVILNVASIAASVGLPDRFAYSMSKGAVLSMTLSVAKDYIKDNIRCNCISPARVHTAFVDNFLKKNYPGTEKEMFEKLSRTQPIGRMARPEEIASLALFLCSDEASFITGSDYPIDGGFLKLNN